MALHFSKHYTREEAQALLPNVRSWLDTLRALRQTLEEQDKQVSALLAPGHDVGGDTVNRWVKTLGQVKDVLSEFKNRQIQIKDLDRGLIDFPAFVGGKEAFLCWEQDEEEIEYWHDLDSGYAGRERL